MTRFARAHGSKSSNERLPEEATSWQVMRRQLEEAQQQQQQHEEIPRKHILKYDFEDKDSQEWAEFENKPEKKENKNRKIEIHVKVKNNVCSKRLNKEGNKGYESRTSMVDETLGIKEKKKQKIRKVGLKDELGNKYYESQAITEKKTEAVWKKREQEKKRVASQDCGSGIEINNEANKEVVHKKRKEKKGPLAFQDGREGFVTENGGKKRKKFKKDQTEQEVLQKYGECVQNPRKLSNIGEQSYNRKLPQGVGSLKKHCHGSNPSKKHQKNGKIHKRRKPDEGKQTIFINGQEITIIRFDGFPVRAEDYVRLKELRQTLIAKGIPQNEIKQVMKLERRKAEKALAREKKKVCFHCRRPGHNLSECPELGDDDQNQNTQSTGICFKCGSTEHTHYQCRVNRSEGFQFAKCFICNEQGHIARQCPDNPRGLYPKGGACRVCGDVTHLKKDCPDLVKEKQDQTMTVETLKSGALEALDAELGGPQPKPASVKKQKLIKF